MAQFRVKIGKIGPQRDEFKNNGRVIEDVDFWTGRAQADDVHAFKRFVVECKLEWAQKTHGFKIVFNMRSHFVRIIGKGLPFDARIVAQALVEALVKYRRIHEFGKPPIVYEGDGEFEFAADDALWACSVLHDLRERDGFGGEASLDPRKFPFQGYNYGPEDETLLPLGLRTPRVRGGTN